MRGPLPGALVVNGGHVTQLLGLVFRRRVAQEAAPANLGPGQVLEQVRLAQVAGWNSM